MLNVMTPAEAASAHARIGMGASFSWASPATPRDRAAEAAVARTASAGPIVVGPRPRALREAAISGTSNAVQQAKSALQQPTSQQYTYKTTRFAALGGGAVGPHAARDPV